MAEYDRLFNNEVVAQMITDAAQEQLGFPRLFPKVSLAEQTDYYTYFKPELTWDEAKKTGKLGKARKIAEGAEFEPLTIRDYKSQTEAFGLVGGRLTLTEEQMTTMPLQAIDVVKEAGRMIIDSVNDDFNNFYNKNAKVSYNQEASDDIPTYLVKAQGKVDEAELNLFATDKKGYEKMRLYLLEQKIPLMPVEEIKTYFGLPNVQLQDMAITKGGRGFGELDVKGIDINKPGIEIMYSPRRGTTSAPVPDEDVAFAPLINVKQDDTRMKQDPAKMDFFISTQYLFLAKNPEYLMKGKLTA